jgi:hypothetical protein
VRSDLSSVVVSMLCFVRYSGGNEVATGTYLLPIRKSLARVALSGFWYNGGRCGLVGDACAGIVGAMIGEWLLLRFKFLFVEAVWSSTRRSGRSCCRFFRTRLAPAEGRGSTGGYYISRKREFGRLAGGLRLKVR